MKHYEQLTVLFAELRVFAKSFEFQNQFTPFRSSVKKVARDRYLLRLSSVLTDSPARTTNNLELICNLLSGKMRRIPFFSASTVAFRVFAFVVIINTFDVLNLYLTSFRTRSSSQAVN